MLTHGLALAHALRLLQEVVRPRHLQLEVPHEVLARVRDLPVRGNPAKIFIWTRKYFWRGGADGWDLSMQLSSSQLFSVWSSLSSHICCSTDTSPLHCSCLASGWVRRLILLLLDCDAEYWAFVTRKVTIIVNLSAQLIMFCKQIHEHKTLLDTHRNIHHHHQSQYTDVHFKVSNPVSFRMHVCRAESQSTMLFFWSWQLSF